MNNKLLLMLMIGLVFVGGCDSYNYNTIQEPKISAIDPTLSIISCPLNITPSVFLYQALDSTSDNPRFFDRTEYEIIRNGNYLGKFEGNRFNKSFLNISYNDELNIIVSAEDEKCYIPNDYIRYFVSCTPNQYIYPKLRCANKFKINILETEYYYTLEELNDTIKTSNDVIKLELRFYDKPDYSFFGCDYDKKYVEKTILTKDYNNLFESDNPVKYAFNKNYYDLYALEDASEYELIVYLKENKLYSQFNTTVYCSFFDEEWLFKNNEIKKSPIDKDWNDLGQDNPSFNFTIMYQG